MLYPSDYFDECNGLIPQIVLCILLLNASKEKTFKNSIFRDISDSANWIETDNLLSLDGYLPLMESRYLLPAQSLVSRINALNSYNVALLSDVVGMPFAGFPTWDTLEPVVLPANIENLSSGQLVVEKRLAYLLLQLEKRNRYYALYNYLRYVKLVSTGNLYKYEIISNPVSGAVISENWVIDNFFAPVIYLKVINKCIDTLTESYPQFKRYLDLDLSDKTINRLIPLCAWLRVRLTTFDVMIPKIDVSALIGQVFAFVEFYRDPSNIVPATFSIVGSGGESNGNIIDGSSSGGEGSGVESPPSFDSGSRINDDPLEEELLTSFSILNSDRPLNSLPEC